MNGFWLGHGNGICRYKKVSFAERGGAFEEQNGAHVAAGTDEPGLAENSFGIAGPGWSGDGEAGG